MKHRTPRRTRWMSALLVIGCTVLGAAAGGAAELVQGPKYQASTDLLVQFWGIQGFLLTGQGAPVSTQDVFDAATLATSPDALDAAARELHDGRDAEALGKVVSATPQFTSHGVTITASGPSATSARRTSAAVAAAVTDLVQQRIDSTVSSLGGLADGDFRTLVRQRAQLLTSSVRPVQVLSTAPAERTAPSLRTPVMLAVVGLAAGVLLVVGFLFAFPVVSRPREAQRLVELPAAAFETPQGGAAAGRMLRRLIEGRPTGTLLVVPVDIAAEKTARHVADWARERATTSAGDAARVTAATEPIGVVLDPRPGDDEVAGVLLVVPQGTPRGTLLDAVALLATWRPVDAVLVTA